MTKNDTVDSQSGFNALVKVGHPVPDFEFEAFHKENIEKFRLSGFKNKWLILFFYPADFTFVCPTELEELADCYKDCVDLEAEIVSMSTDTVFTHKAWHDTSDSIKKIEFPMGADPSGRISRAFGTLIESGSLDYVEDEGLALGAVSFGDELLFLSGGMDQ